MESGTFTKNHAGDSGGAIYVNDAELKLYGGSITQNTAQLQGGGVLVGKAGALYTHGAPVVQNNTAEGKGNDIFLRDGKQINVDAALTGDVLLGVDAEKRDKAFTKNFGKNNSGKDPATYFTTNDNWVVLNSGGEGIIRQSNWSLLQAQVDAAKSGDTIRLEQDYKSVSEDASLTIPKDMVLTIDLNGHTLDRALKERTNNGSVIVNSGTLTITGEGKITGGNTDGNGGGILNQGTLNVEGVSIEGNKARNLGGGVYNASDADMTLDDGAIRKNGADQGAGIFTEGKLNISGGEISANTATGDGGGAVAILKGTATLTGGKLTGNVSENHQGGGIYMRGGTVNLYGGEITGNRAALDGGGILYNKSGVLNVQGAPVVRDNSASCGANILLRPGSVVNVTGKLTYGARLDVLAQDVDKPLTQGMGASGSSPDAFTYDEGKGVSPTIQDGELVVSFDIKADVWVSDWSGLQKAIDSATEGQVIGLSKDIAAGDAGRIKVSGDRKITLELNGHRMDRQRISSDKDGHVIEVRDSAWLTIRDSRGTGVIQGGWATNGGGINIAEDAGCTLESGTIRGNKAKNGGGVYAHGYLWMNGGTISDNEASNSGGGICADDQGLVWTKSGEITNNTAKQGGGVYVDGCCAVDLMDTHILNNNANENGGGVCVKDGGGATLVECELRGNAAKKDGGAISTDKDCKLTLDGCTIEDNTAGNRAGAIFTKGDTELTGNRQKADEGSAGAGANRSNPARGETYPNRNNQNTEGFSTGTSLIRNNIAKSNGGAIYISSGETTVDNVEVTGNISTEGSGGGIYVGASTLRLYGGEITGNTAQTGGGVFLQEDRGNAHILIHGAPVVKDNAAKTGNNVCLASFIPMVQDGAMTDGAMLYITPGDTTGRVVGAFNRFNEGQDPARYFAPDSGLTVALDAVGDVSIVLTDWNELQKEFDAAENGATITMQRDWKGGRGDEPLTVREGKTITLDLNGHTLDRNKDLSDRIIGNGSVIKIEHGATLTIRDSADTGVITGSKGDAGIENFGTLHLAGGTITGNQGTSGGGVYNYSGKAGTASMTMNGGKITGNYATSCGGGIYNEGILTISGGEITDNKTDLDGGGLYLAGGADLDAGQYLSEGTVTITGGKISKNTATERNGGGIFLDYNATLNLNGGSITDNRAAQDGGGIYYGAKGTLNAQGAPEVKDNTASRGNNIMMLTGKVLNVTGALTAEAKLDLMAQDLSNPLTKDFARYNAMMTRNEGYRDVFTYNKDLDVHPTLRNGEIFVDLDAKADVYVTDWKGLQKAFEDTESGKVIALSNDIVANGGDRIKVKGGKTMILDLNGYALDRGLYGQGYSSNGHVIEILDNSTLTIKDTRGMGIVTGGAATRGGGINIEKGSTCILESGAIRRNGAKWGGGVYAHGTFKMTGGLVSNNGANDSGGGIHCGSEGTLDMTGGTVSNNTSSEDGGGIYNSGSKNVNISNVRITGNIAKGKDSFEQDDPDFKIGDINIVLDTQVNYTQYYYGGAGFSNDKGGIARLKNCVITDNHGYSNGGGVYNTKKSALTMEDCTVQNNNADLKGGGVFTAGKLTVNGGKYTGNTVGSGGGGILVTADDNAALNISGALEVHDNTAGQGANVYLASGKAMTVDGAMAAGAKINVTLQDGTGVFAKDFEDKNPGNAPDLYFVSDVGYLLLLESGDAVLQRELFDDSDLKISRTASYRDVNSRNWLSAVPGERMLNEINIPGTHDSSMNNLRVIRLSSLTTTGGMETNARTQYLYIDEQLDAGYRWLDLRCNNKVQNSFYDTFAKEVDDGVNLWMCHGKEFVGTIWAADRDGSALKLATVLNWVKTFLKDNPTEFVVLDFSAETGNSSDIPIIHNRVKKYIKQLAQDTNPSTGKPYLYMEDDEVGKGFSAINPVVRGSK